jgi:uncharacterized RDD family membrane protein YckC
MTDIAVSLRYAGFWRRLGGIIIDAIIVGVISGIIDVIARAVNAEGTGVQAGVGLIVGLLYYIWGWGRGQTVGCMVLNIKLINQDTGDEPGYGKAVIRYIVNIFCGITGILAIIGGLWMIWDSKKQTWWDKVAGTLVVEA